MSDEDIGQDFHWQQIINEEKQIRKQIDRKGDGTGQV